MQKISVKIVRDSVFSLREVCLPAAFGADILPEEISMPASDTAALDSVSGTEAAMEVNGVSNRNRQLNATGINFLNFMGICLL